MFRSQCGKQILDTSIFCSFCGVKISNIENHAINKAEYYWSLAKPYLPNVIKFLLIAESPPKNPKNYFYYIGSGQGNYCFFQNIILGTTGIKYRGDIEEKKRLLTMFRQRGFFLIDAVETPLKGRAEDEILKSKPRLFERLIEFNINGKVNPATKIVLIKNLVCGLLKTPLEENNSIIFDKSTGVHCVPYPRYYTDPNCYENLRNIIVS